MFYYLRIFLELFIYVCLVIKWLKNNYQTNVIIIKINPRTYFMSPIYHKLIFNGVRS